MGITGLWKIVEPTATEIPLECLEGKKLAIDVSIWIYQAQLSYPSDQPYPHLRLLVNRLSKLLFYKIRPIFVFDGPAVPELKKQVLESRRQRRLDDDDLVKNPKKMRQLKEIAGGRLDEVALKKTIQEVISPSKKVILNDVYKDIPSTSTDYRVPEPSTDQLNYHFMSDKSEDDSGDSDDEDIQFIPQKEEEILKKEQKTREKVENPQAVRRERIQNLVEKRENMRNSRLHPAMIPVDSKNFSSFQLQRLLQRGRLNQEIEKLAKSSTSSSCSLSTTDKINVTGPDGTRHVLQYAYSDEIRQVAPQNTREIDSLYQQPSKLEMSLDLFNVQYGGKMYSREVTPDDVREEVVERMEERLVDKKETGWQSKSGMLEVIARKRVRQHYGNIGAEVVQEQEDDKGDKDLEQEDIIGSDELALQEALLASVAEKINASKYPHLPNLPESQDSEDWDPQRYDQPSTSSATHLNSEIVRLNYEEDDKTPELYRDLQEFLTNCGVPWIEAPGEAEAQCVELERLGLVDGVVSDDSDVWAFGARHVYRHMFARNKRVQRYGETTARNKMNLGLFCLQREDFISIGLLSGGDYCPGLSKVGAIGALELVSEFVEKREKMGGEDLESVEERIMRLLENVRHLFNSAPDDVRTVSRNAMMLRRHVTEANEKEVIEMVCTNRAAVLAYLHPTIDSSSEKFRWRPMNIQLVRQILQQRLNWPDRSQRNEEKNSLEAFEKWNAFLASGGISQMRLDRFFAQKIDNSLELTWSKKVKEALERIAKRTKGEPIEEEIRVVEVKKTTEMPKNPRKRGPAKNKKKQIAKNPPKNAKKIVKKLNLSEESSENDSFDDDVV